jgi:hypothetical protein
MSQESHLNTAHADPHWRRWPIVELLVLAAPTVAQMASYTLMQFTDRYMLARRRRPASGGGGDGGDHLLRRHRVRFGVLLVVNTIGQPELRAGDSRCHRQILSGRESGSRSSSAW